MSTPAVVATPHNTTPNPATQTGTPKVNTPESLNDGPTSSAIATKDSANNDAVPSKSNAAPSNTTAQAKTSLATSSTAESKKKQRGTTHRSERSHFTNSRKRRFFVLNQEITSRCRMENL